MTLENENINTPAVEPESSASEVSQPKTAVEPAQPKFSDGDKDPFGLQSSQSTEAGSDKTNLPVSEQASPDLTNEHSAADASTSNDESVNYLPLIFRDGLDMPIVGLDLRVTLPSGEICEAVTSQYGSITIPIAPQTEGKIKVEVKDATSKHQNVCEIDAAKCSNAVIIRSPKVKAEIPLRPHQQVVPPKVSASAPAESPSQTTAPASKPEVKPAKPDLESPWWSANGAMHEAWTWISKTLHLGDDAPKPPPAAAPQKTTAAKPASGTAKPVVVLKAKAKTVTAKALNTAGQPVAVVVGGECPNKDKLRMGRNNVYRTIIVEAAKRVGLIPQALCILISCEAACKAEILPLFGPDGKTPLKDKKGKPRTYKVKELWNPSSGDNPAKAKGLTQFIVKTWLGHVMQPGFYIHEQSIAQGWLRQESDKKKGTHWVFVLSDGETTSKPNSHHGDANVKACLAMRDDPTWSINAAADYGAANLKILEKHGFKLDGLSDIDKAKMMYLMHHEGEDAGPKFIRNRLTKPAGTVAEMTTKLVKKHGEKKAKEMIDAENGDVEKIFRKPLAANLRSKFIQQLGDDSGPIVDAKIAKAGGDVAKAYRFWFQGYVDGKFNESNRYFCSDPQKPTQMSKVLVLIGGVEIDDVPK